MDKRELEKRINNISKKISEFETNLLPTRKKVKIKAQDILIEMSSSLFITGFIGWLIDSALSLKPVFTVLLMLIGLLVGIKRISLL